MGQVRFQRGLGYGGIWKSIAAASYDLLIIDDRNDGDFKQVKERGNYYTHIYICKTGILKAVKYTNQWSVCVLVSCYFLFS